MTENPYRYVGQIVRGTAFIGRTDLLWRVRSSWAGSVLGNLSVQGSHRMGKTSLVARAVELDQDTRADLLFVSLSIGNHESGPDLFRSVVRETHAKLGTVSAPSAVPYRPMFDQILTEVSKNQDWFELRDIVSAFFTHLTHAGVSVVIVLDEFDRATAVLTRLADYQFLRSLASERPSVGLVTISRRPIDDIEIDAVHGSTLDNVLSLRCNVGCFSDLEIDEVLAPAATIGVDLSSHRREITEIAGGHPYLLSLLCHETIMQFHRVHVVSVTAAHRNLINQFETQFKTLYSALNTSSANRAGDLLLRVSHNRCDSISPIDLDLLRRLGLLHENGISTRLFSDEFDRFVRRTVLTSAN